MTRSSLALHPPEAHPASQPEAELAPPRSYVLSSGQQVELRAPLVPFVSAYRVLSWPLPRAASDREATSATAAEIDEMFALAHRIARERGAELFGDPECFAVLYNGARARRMPWPHFHLIPARTPAERRWVLACLLLKRVSRRVLRALPAWLGGRWRHA